MADLRHDLAEMLAELHEEHGHPMVIVFLETTEGGTNIGTAAAGMSWQAAEWAAKAILSDIVTMAEPGHCANCEAVHRRAVQAAGMLHPADGRPLDRLPEAGGKTH